MTLLQETNPHGGDNYYVCFDYVKNDSSDQKYQIYYQYDLGSHTDSACQEMIDDCICGDTLI